MKAICGKELGSVLDQHGWELRRIRGSHHIYCKPGSVVRLSVPVHGNKPLGERLLKHLLKMAEIPEDAV